MMHRDALFSPDRKYRYRLMRQWARGGKGTLTFCMLNPSLADYNREDPTVRRCIGFAMRDGYCGLEVVNIAGIVGPYPDQAFSDIDPYGPYNDKALETCVASDGRVICAWGTNAPEAAVQRAVQCFTRRGLTLWCLGVNSDGSPKHPLYVRKDQPFITWNPPQGVNP